MTLVIVIVSVALVLHLCLLCDEAESWNTLTTYLTSRIPVNKKKRVHNISRKVLSGVNTGRIKKKKFGKNGRGHAHEEADLPEDGDLKHVGADLKLDYPCKGYEIARFPSLEVANPLILVGSVL